MYHMEPIYKQRSRRGLGHSKGSQSRSMTQHSMWITQTSRWTFRAEPRAMKFWGLEPRPSPWDRASRAGHWSGHTGSVRVFREQSQFQSHLAVSWVFSPSLKPQSNSTGFLVFCFLQIAVIKSFSFSFHERKKEIIVFLLNSYFISLHIISLKCVILIQSPKCQKYVWSSTPLDSWWVWNSQVGTKGCGQTRALPPSHTWLVHPLGCN